MILRAMNGDLDGVRLLQEYGANVTIHVHSGATALILAATLGHGDIVEALLEDETLNVNAEDKKEELLL